MAESPHFQGKDSSLSNNEGKVSSPSILSPQGHRPKKAVELTPETAVKVSSLLRSAELYISRSNYAGAEKELARAAALAPWNPTPHRLLGRLLLRLGKLREAEVAFRKWIKVAGKDPEAHFFLGFTCYERDLYDRALDSFDRVLELSPHYQSSENFFGERLNKGEFLKRFREDCLKKLTTDVGYSERRFKDGVLLLKFRKYERAMEDFRRVLAVNPRHVEARLYLAHALMQRRQDEEAARELEQVLQYNPRNTEAQKGLALIHVQRGEDEKARGYFEQIVRLDPSDAEAQEYLSELKKKASGGGAS